MNTDEFRFLIIVAMLGAILGILIAGCSPGWGCLHCGECPDGFHMDTDLGHCDVPYQMDGGLP